MIRASICGHTRTDVFERKHELVGVCLDCNFEFELTEEQKRTVYDKARYILKSALAGDGIASEGRQDG